MDIMPITAAADAIATVRPDLCFGSAEAYRLGYEAARAEMRESPETTKSQPNRVKKD